MDAIAQSRPRSRQTVYTRIQQVKHAPELRPALRALLRSIVDYCGKDDECWPSVARLAAECGITPRYCRQLLRRLEQLGWIEHRPRFRPDGSQASSLLVWTHQEPVDDAGPGTIVPPPRNNSSALEASRENSGNEEHAGGPPECGKVMKTISEPIEPATTPAPAPRRRQSRRFIVIDNSKVTDAQELKRVHELAVVAGLLNGSESSRLAFCAAWCAVARKFREGIVHNPAGSLQFLLRNPGAMLEYATQADEDKARKAIRILWPTPAYCPHG
jgi:hypothetical protein